MKIRNMLFTGLLVAGILAFSGCAAVQKKLLTETPSAPHTVQQPVFSVDPVTHQPYQSGVTNLVVNSPAYVPNPTIQGYIDAGTAVFTSAASVPSPLTPVFGGLALLFAGAGSWLGIYAKRKSGELTLSNAALAATTTAIETADNAVKLKESARVASQANGSQDYLHEQVKNL